jgi:hypothetical protein
VRHDQECSDDVLAFRQFRRNVVGFLRLPLDVRESALRDALHTISPGLLAIYKHRAAQATLTWASMCRTDMQSLQVCGQPVSAASAPPAPNSEESAAAAI